MRGSAEDRGKSANSCSAIHWWRDLAQETFLNSTRIRPAGKNQWPTAEMLIGNIDDYGYIKARVDELALSTGAAPDPDSGEVLKAFRRCDPAGVGARLCGTLLLQLERSGQTKYPRVPDRQRFPGRPIGKKPHTESDPRHRPFSGPVEGGLERIAPSNPARKRCPSG